MAAMAPTPPASSSTGSTGEGLGVGGSRQMRLKVSYSFDDYNKANCLARWPHLVNTPVVKVDQDLVGAVELKTCILGIVAASPELVATLGQDYSVYACDFSEPGVPLVGCGMLSWAMLDANGSSTRTMITGRVNCNQFGFFNNDGIKETLEVQLKLQEVPTFTQGQFVNSVHVYNAVAKTLPGNFDASAWSNFIKANPQILAECTQQPPPAPLPPAPSARPSNQPSFAEPWREAHVSNAEESGQPPKKKARVASKKPTKTAGGRKKGKNTNTESAASTPDVDGSATDAPTPFPESSAVPQPSLSALSRGSLLPDALPEVSPSPQNTNVMASSPPQSEGVSEEGISPAPTSPVLPALPAPLRNEQSLENASEIPETPPFKIEPQSEIARPEMVDEQSTLLLPPPMTAAAHTDAVPPPPVDAPATKSKKPRKKQPKKSAKSAEASSSMAPGENLPGSDSNMDKPKRSRTAVHAKERIQKQLMEAIERGEMPNFCQNCGAIETPVWRKVKVKESGGQEGDILLCNPCGLWHSTRKSMRPKEFWDGRKTEPSSRSRKRKKSESVSTPAASNLLQQLPEAHSELQSEIAADGDEETPRLRSLSMVGRGVTMTPSVSRSAQDINTEWNEAIAASRRIAQSSPVAGSADSPIEIDGVVDGHDSPRRLLFGHARRVSSARLVIKDGVAAIAPDDGAADKENDDPARFEILHPTTPVKNLPASRSMQTPLRSASRRLPPRQSPWKAAVYASATKGKTRSPETPERLRLAKSEQQRNQLSPSATQLERLLAEMEADPNALSSIPDLSTNPFSEMEDDFWNSGIHTDLSMPSSPPGQLDLFDGPIQDEEGKVGDWSTFVPVSPDSLNIAQLFEGVGGIGGMGTEKDLTVDLSSFLEENRSRSGTDRASSVASSKE